MRRSEKDTHDIEGTDTVHATVHKHSVDTKCIPKPFIPGAACETSVNDVWISTISILHHHCPTERQDQDKVVKTPSFKTV